MRKLAEIKAKKKNKKKVSGGSDQPAPPVIKKADKTSRAIFKKNQKVYEQIEEVDEEDD